MSRRSKLEKFEELNKLPNVYQNLSFEKPQLEYQEAEIENLSGSWNQQHFRKEAPLILELACGRGEYCLGMASMYPLNQYIGVDIKGARLWKGARLGIEAKLDNMAFLRTRIELIDHFFASKEIDEIWITFPDPFLKKSKANKRLTSPLFLEKYRHILKEHNQVHLKTDSPEMAAYTLEVCESWPHAHLQFYLEDVHNKDHDIPELNIITFYEKIHLKAGKKIFYIKFTLDIPV
jgi:tRNA (guanine-N7-)-methyltransferase